MNAFSLKPTERARFVLLASVILTAPLYVVPYARHVAYPLMLLSTLAHEMGHGVAALLNREILSVGLATPAVSLNRSRPNLAQI